MRFAGHRKPRKKVVLDAACGIIIGKKRRSRRCPEVLRMSQGNWELCKHRLIALSGHLQHKIRSPVSL